ncbi:MAG: OsmC family protein [Acidobacteriia bacterium]|nr:OsmC family protein [Terriglobia bacterium]
MSLIVNHLEQYTFEAQTRNHVIHCDQPATSGGADHGMTPTEIFVAALGLSIGVYIEHFCRARNLPGEKFSIHLDWELEENPTRVSKITACIHLPHEIPERYREALRHAAESCPLEHTLKAAPKIEVQIG